MDEKLDGEEIHDWETEDHPPEDGVGPDEGAVGEGQHGYDEEEDQHAAVYMMEDFVLESTNLKNLLLCVVYSYKLW